MRHTQLLLSLTLLVGVATACQCSGQIGDVSEVGGGSSAATNTSATSQPAQTSSPAASVGRVARAELGTGRDDDFTPTTTFTADTPEIVAEWDLEGVTPGSTIKSIWIADDTGGVAPPNYKIDEKAMTISDEDTGTFSLSRPTNGWPVGTYHLEIELNGTTAKSLPFRIEAAEE